ncbi:hypothetical protein HY628_00735 [Candidatus Uhrbacteria bacterium]|nr:hypothetical protein [Candidatus Uhrbacteria bacterium]
MEERKPNYMDLVRAEFVRLATDKGVEPMVADELSVYVTEKMMSSWRNGMRVGFQKSRPGAAPQAVAA